MAAAADMGIEEVSIEFDLGKEDPALGTVSKWAKTGDMYFGVRFYFTDKVTGELRPGKNGITVQFGQAINLIEALITTYNVATGNDYLLMTRSELLQGGFDVDEE